MKTKTYQGIVMEITSETITLLCKDGTFKNVPRSKDKMPMIGEQYTHIEKQRLSMVSTKYASLVAVLLVAVIAYAFFPFTEDNQAYLYAVDINPSIEIYTNEELLVTSIEPLNEDGQKVVDAISEQDQHVDVILDEIIDIAIKQDFLTKDEKGMVALTVVPLHDQLEFDDLVTTQRLNQSIQTHQVAADVSVKKGTKDLIDASKQKDLSVNKYQVYKQLEQDKVEVDLEQLRKTPIPAFIKELKEKQAQNKPNQANPNAKTNNGKQHGVHKEKPVPNPPSNQGNHSKEQRNDHSNQQNKGPSERSEKIKKQTNNGKQTGLENKQEKQNSNNQNQGNPNANQKEPFERQNKNGKANQNNKGANHNANQHGNQGQRGKPQSN